jgi:hypothetical protein
MVLVALKCPFCGSTNGTKNAAFRQHNRLIRKLKRVVGIVEKCEIFCLTQALVSPILTFPNKSIQ